MWNKSDFIYMYRYIDLYLCIDIYIADHYIDQYISYSIFYFSVHLMTVHRVLFPPLSETAYEMW